MGLSSKASASPAASALIAKNNESEYDAKLQYYLDEDYEASLVDFRIPVLELLQLLLSRKLF